MLTLCLFSSDLIKAEMGRKYILQLLLLAPCAEKSTCVQTPPTSENCPNKDPGAEEEVSSQRTVICGQFALNQSKEDPENLQENQQDMKLSPRFSLQKVPLFCSLFVQLPERRR